LEKRRGTVNGVVDGVEFMPEDPTKKFRDEISAYKFVEAAVWPDGPICPHCHGKSHISMLRGASTRQNTYKCYDCCKPFTVKVGTILEGSKVPLHKWLQAFVLANANKRQVDPSRMSEALGLTYKTASFILSRIRAVKSRHLSRPIGRTRSELGNQPGNLK
jgi:transposase-like protein